MKTFKIGFVGNTGLFSWLIRTLTRSNKISHVYIAYEMDTDGYDTAWFTLQASDFKIWECAYDDYVPNCKFVKEFKLEVPNDFQYLTALKLFHLKYLNKPYDWRSIFGFGISLAVKYLSFGAIKLKNPLRGSDRKFGFYCSEMVLDFLQTIYPDPVVNVHFLKYDQDLITPNDLENLMADYGCKGEIIFDKF